ncbi:MAG: PleD family two-component system response regulator [Cohaesibacteraceae bacterium]|nr:PleD family two-component system response regulator [Cohaesibacteraceae bacterium]
MTAKILVVDDIAANVKLLEARLMAEYFDVVTASSGAEALQILDDISIDIVLLDIMMPGMDGFEVCERIKKNPSLMHIPVVMVTALDQPRDRVRGLAVGADDFLTKPVNDIALVTRVRNLVRLKVLTDELRARAATSQQLGLDDTVISTLNDPMEGARILLVDDRSSSRERIASYINKIHVLDVEEDPQSALFRVADADYDLIIVSLGLQDFDGLRLCSQIRSLEQTRSVPLIVIAEQDDQAKILRALDIGVNDHILRPLDKHEMIARIATQIRGRRYTEQLRHSVQQTMEMAITDSLTGLHNRRYLESHLSSLMRKAARLNKPISVLMLDIDHFKAVNDTYGHDAGDVVLKDFSNRIRKSIRGIDLACRMGGEEFIVVMPDTDPALAIVVAERIRKSISDKVIVVPQTGTRIEITVSIGIAARSPGLDQPETIMKAADTALYSAKREGRNRVVAAAA